MGEITRRTALFIEAVRAFLAVRRRRRLMPSRAYLEWRAYTAYGDHKAGIGRRDLFHYLAWRRQLRRNQRAWPP